MFHIDFKIDNSEIEKSFDRIAIDLLTKSHLIVNDKKFRITEIEFYYFHEDYHQDNYTHEHKRHEGEWRFHNQGLDITFASDSKSDGGILIRGIVFNDVYVNGPRNIISKIFEEFGKVNDNNCLKLSPSDAKQLEIIKTFRHLPNKQVDDLYLHKYYRYLSDLDFLKIPENIKEMIKMKFIKL
jgi:hypothetical protein